MIGRAVAPAVSGPLQGFVVFELAKWVMQRSVEPIVEFEI